MMCRLVMTESERKLQTMRNRYIRVLL